MRTRLIGLVLCALALSARADAATILLQDFEAGLGANESTGGAFVINSTGFDNNGTMMMGHPGGYGNNAYDYYQLILDLTGVTNAAMSFDYVGEFETHFDRFNLLAAVGGVSPPSGLLSPTGASNMQFIDHFDNHHPNLGQFAYDTSSSSGGAGGVALFDLSDFDGLSDVYLRFQFGSDSSVTAAGFGMDNLEITGDVEAAPIPEPSSLILLGSGVAGVLAKLRRRRRQAQ